MRAWSYSPTGRTGHYRPALSLAAWSMATRTSGQPAWRRYEDPHGPLHGGGPTHRSVSTCTTHHGVSRSRRPSNVNRRRKGRRQVMRAPAQARTDARTSAHLQPCVRMLPARRSTLPVQHAMGDYASVQASYACRHPAASVQITEASHGKSHGRLANYEACPGRPGPTPT